MIYLLVAYMACQGCQFEIAGAYGNEAACRQASSDPYLYQDRKFFACVVRGQTPPSRMELRWMRPK